MYIYNPNKLNVNYNKPFLKENNNLYYFINHFLDNIIYPSNINDIVGIYLSFDKEINEKEDILIKKILKKYIDAGFTNLMKDTKYSYFIIRFNIVYEQQCKDIMNINEDLLEMNFNMKCSIVYANKYTTGFSVYENLKDYINTIKDTDDVLCSNYYEYLSNKEK